MALIAKWETANGYTGRQCHAGCGHVLEFREWFAYLENVAPGTYEPWCESCAATLGLVRES